MENPMAAKILPRKAASDEQKMRVNALQAASVEQKMKVKEQQPQPILYSDLKCVDSDEEGQWYDEGDAF